jgi:FKBP-type peptidyl-prolyl cis-trans isomerase SlyD
MIKQGSQVKLHYTLTVDGEVLDSSRDREPHAYVHGAGQMMPGLEEQLEGMVVGDKKSATVAPEKAYGPHQSDAVHQVPKSAFSDPTSLEAGGRVSGEASGQEFQATITEVGDDDVTLDLNHPLAGKTLEFELEIVDVS